MFKRALLIAIFMVCIGMIRPAKAARIGGLVGFGQYWSEYDGLSGITLSTYLDIMGGNFDIAPTLSFWIRSEYSLIGIDFTDITPGIAFKYYFSNPDAKTTPYIGIEPQWHVLAVPFFGYAESYFGISAFAGLSINTTMLAQIPIQVSYGKIFTEGTTLSTFTAKIGLAAKL